MNRKSIIVRLRYQALGLVFLVVVAVFVSGTIAVYNKAFTDVVPVRLQVDKPGSQLSVGADVKVRGIQVGRVSSIETADDGASLTLALRPEKVDGIPANVGALILPKTLFGQRYVSLRLPDDPAAATVESGDVIAKDRSDAAIELETVLTDVVPLLNAVEPQKLASTLNAISSALEGRGQQLGDTLTRVSKLLDEVDDSLPDIKADIDKFADVAETYDDIAPDVLRGLSNLTTTTQTVVEKRKDLNNLYASLIGGSGDLRSFLAANKHNLIRLTGEIQPTLDVFAKYAPEYPCLLNQMAESVPNARKTFGAGTEHPESNKVIIEFIPGGQAYEPDEDEHVNAEDRGPRCYPLPEDGKNFPQYPPGGPIQDGTSEHSKHAGEDVELSQPVKGLNAPFEPGVWDEDGDGGGGSVAGSGAVPSLANSPAEQDLLSVLLAPQLDVAVTEVPGWSSLLIGPLYRGKEVELQ